MSDTATVTTIRLSEADRRRLAKVADKMELSRSDTIRFLIRSAAGEQHMQERFGQSVQTAVKLSSREPVPA